VGVILPKRQGFAVPIGERTFDKHTLAEIAAGAAVEDKP
jgi:hypothetical protein